MRETVLALALSVACLGCGAAGAGAGGPSGTELADREGRTGGAESLFDQLGGVDALRALVDDLVLRIAADERVHHLLRERDIAALKEELVAVLCAETGGPCERRGEPPAEALAAQGVTEAQLDAMIEHLAAALEAQGAPRDPSRELLDRAAATETDIVSR